MCLIIDANTMHKVFGRIPDPEFKPIHNALYGRPQRARLVVGGSALENELRATSRFLQKIRKLHQAGRARRVESDKVDEEAAALEGSGICRSDDPHIIALARVARVRLLCTFDDDLTDDFTNPRILNRPRGKVYRQASHRHLIGRHCAHIHARRSS